ncbi:M23 family metallopeptidase [Leptospira gomenensis]|uniref:M23 family metallopeptidase n=1 Tax=Leptospira gomenensis TaxID=2484974 RepID=A0A5F1Y6T5_9LEPT|nr:M23 family metallopeptidase [Leptospira gomenensis]TGK27970.1 M23 family metallopeptidase [Leptospira gomenensis]TGK37175.1 M23 family metallopeptidase [Leptospira gomenensis]TGK45811.1 M23 family metallopeptidase [Leptospira gomenensis]TGK59750.1 M23 family metallopeptidase [Leptospira gomenensis]
MFLNLIFPLLTFFLFLSFETNTLYSKEKAGPKETKIVSTTDVSKKEKHVPSQSKKQDRKNETQTEFIRKKEPLFSFSIQARRFAQGEVLFLRLIPEKTILSKLDRIKILWEKKEVPYTMKDSVFHAWIPVSPEFEKKSGVLEIQDKNLFRKNDFKEYEIPIQKTNFSETKVSSLTMDKKYTSQELPKETLDFIAECSRAKSEAFQSKTDLQVWTDFVYPVREVHFTSPFYKRRVYNKIKGKAHGGVDFKGGTGTQIFAINDGTVVLARPMYYEGNFTVIDHGLEMYSLYMHQSELGVKAGDKVKKGDPIGKIGSTGMSTGPHLHLGLRVRGTMVDPLSVVGLKIFGEISSNVESKKTAIQD